MKRLIIPTLLLLGILYFFNGCYYDKFNELHPLDGYINTCADSLPDTYTDVTRIIIASNCISCHDSKQHNGDIVLETYQQVKAAVNSGELMGAILHQKDYEAMPPGTSLRDCDIEQIQQWIDNGMPE